MLDQILAKLAEWKPFKVVVVGDFMLDQLVHGEASRLSADAPVPVLLCRGEEDRPGGAANVCLNLAAMRGHVTAVGVIGQDLEGQKLRVALASRGVDVSGLTPDPPRPTTVKRSLVGLAQGRHPQKMFRIDVESVEPLRPGAEDALIAAFEAALPGASAVCIEDYHKGVCTPRVCAAVIERCRRSGVAVLVDPAARTDFSKYRGATVITPNRTEAEAATGMRTDDRADAAHNARLARVLLERLDLRAVVLTLDRHGALLLEQGAERAVVVPTVAREVYDVTGAGDMVLAALAAGRANGMDWPEAVTFANAAAGLEVEVFGVQPIPIERIHHDVLMRSMGGGAGGGGSGGRLRTLEQVRVELAAVRSVGKRVVFTNGCFDVMHAGHVALLERARAIGDYLVVGLNSDDSVRRLKGAGRPINTAADRAALLGALRAVDAVVVFEQDTPLELIRATRPDVLVKGGDYTRERVVGHEIVEAWGGRVELIDLLEGRSTTSIIERARTA